MSLRYKLILLWATAGSALLILSSYSRWLLVPLTALAIVLNVILWLENSK